MILDISKYMSSRSRTGRAARRLAGLALAGLAAACAESPPPCRVDTLHADTRRGDAGCLIASDEKVLLVVHRIGGKLGFPGGGAHGDELAQCAAHRETWEETGLDVTVGPLVREFREGFLLYACDPGGEVTSTSAPALEAWSNLEVTELVWRDAARETTWRDWRFPAQRRAARDLVPEGEATGGQ